MRIAFSKAFRESMFDYFTQESLQMLQIDLSMCQRLALLCEDVVAFARFAHLMHYITLVPGQAYEYYTLLTEESGFLCCILPTGNDPSQIYCHSNVRI